MAGGWDRAMLITSGTFSVIYNYIFLLRFKQQLSNLFGENTFVRCIT